MKDRSKSASSLMRGVHSKIIASAFSANSHLVANCFIMQQSPKKAIHVPCRDLAMDLICGCTILSQLMIAGCGPVAEGPQIGPGETERGQVKRVAQSTQR